MASIAHNSSSHRCREYSEEYHPCVFPFTSRATAFNLEGGSTACDVTYSESTGDLHTSSCIFHSVSATIIMFAFLRLFYRSVKKRTDREKKKPGGRQPTKRTSLVEMAKSVSSELRRASEMADRASFKIKKSNPMTSFCFGLSTIEESYLLFTLGYALVAIGSIDIGGFANRIPFRSDSLIIESVYSMFTSIAMFVVTSWAKSFYRRNMKTMIMLDKALYCSLVVMWIISMISCVFETYEAKRGTYMLHPNRVKHFTLMVIDLLYAAMAAGLGLKLRSTLAKSSLNRKTADSAQSQAQRTIGAFSVGISIGLTVVFAFRLSRILQYWGDERAWASPPCDVLSSTFFMPYTGPVVFGAIVLICLENCDCCKGTVVGSGGGSMLGLVMDGSSRRLSLGNLAWSSSRSEGSSTDSNGSGNTSGSGGSLGGSSSSLQTGLPEKISEVSDEGSARSGSLPYSDSEPVRTSTAGSMSDPVPPDAVVIEMTSSASSASSAPSASSYSPATSGSTSTPPTMGAPAASPKLSVQTKGLGGVGAVDGATESPLHIPEGEGVEGAI
mmetsp:Transcript_89772/g.256582  ORF Transcript_89772/g.256582 Transcript_89772/m.256582 type:complete len:555 (+) Transcript_89772:193-1857(+)